MEGKDILAKWLRDAHAMETSLASTLQNHAEEAGAFPEISGQVEQHLEETKRHAEVIEDCLTSLGEDVSRLKESLAKLGGVVQGVDTGGTNDELIKSAISDFASEQYEIATYKALIELARQLNEAGIATSLEQNLREEEEMAEWLADGLSAVVRTSIRELTPAEPAGSFFEKIEVDEYKE